MKKIIYTLFIFFILSACSSPTTSSSDDDQDPINPPDEAVEFVEDIIVSDGVNAVTLTFGLQKGLTSEYDPDVDIESPPFNPPGSFFAHFAIPEHNLFKDLRPGNSESANWRLQLPDEGNKEIELSWNFDINNFKGTITLQDQLENPEVVVDMLGENSFTSDLQSIDDDLVIVYSL